MTTQASKSGIARTLLDFASDDGTVQGADPNDPDNAGNTPLHIAAESGSVEMVDAQLLYHTARHACHVHLDSVEGCEWLKGGKADSAPEPRRLLQQLHYHAVPQACVPR